MRNTPLQSKRARQGFTPLPLSQTTTHNVGLVVPEKTHTIMVGTPQGAFPAAGART